MELSEIVSQYGTPDPSIVRQKPSNYGASDYVGHAEVTKMLIEIDPMWSWEPVSWIEGRPAIHINEVSRTFSNGEVKKSRIATMWGFMTVLGKQLPCVGSASADKDDLEKELIGDLIRNGALRFGICINLWTKADSAALAPSYQRPTQQYEKRESKPVATGGGIRIKGDQHGELPAWLEAVAAEQGIVEVYDNRDTATPQNRRPWFKCTSSGAPIWPPKGTPAPAPVVTDQFPDDEEPF